MYVSLKNLCHVPRARLLLPLNRFYFLFLSPLAPSCRSKACALFPPVPAATDFPNVVATCFVKISHDTRRIRTTGVAYVCAQHRVNTHVAPSIRGSREIRLRERTARRIGKQFKCSTVFSVKVDSPKFI